MGVGSPVVTLVNDRVRRGGRGGGGSPLNGRYLVRNRGWNAALRVTDAVLSAVARANRPKIHDPATDPRRDRWPSRRRGDRDERLTLADERVPGCCDWNVAAVVVARRSRRASAAAVVHHADHWKMNRGAAGAAVSGDDIGRPRPRVKELTWLATTSRSISMRTIRTRRGCCGEPGFRADRATPVAGAALYTHALDWHPDLGHTALQHRRLIRSSAQSDSAAPRYDLPPIAPDARERAVGSVRGAYVIIRSRDRGSKKAWPEERWSQLVARLVSRGERVVITGRGETDERIAADLQACTQSVLNLAGRLDWPPFVPSSPSSMLMGPDSWQRMLRPPMAFRRLPSWPR